MILYSPLPLVMADRTFSMRAGLDASTVTPGRTAPLGSVTVPPIAPVVACADRAAGTKRVTISQNGIPCARISSLLLHGQPLFGRDPHGSDVELPADSHQSAFLNRAARVRIANRLKPSWTVRRVERVHRAPVEHVGWGDLAIGRRVYARAQFDDAILTLAVGDGGARFLYERRTRGLHGHTGQHRSGCVPDHACDTRRLFRPRSCRQEHERPHDRGKDDAASGHDFSRVRFETEGLKTRDSPEYSRGFSGACACR